MIAYVKLIFMRISLTPGGPAGTIHAENVNAFAARAPWGTGSSGMAHIRLITGSLHYGTKHR
jgi:hypothetical protein